jgi:endoglucanase
MKLSGSVQCVGLLLLSAACQSAPIAAAPALPARPPATVAESAPLQGFMRGMNLGNALDAPAEGDWGVVLSERHFEQIAAAGFDHVRLPVRFNAHAQPAFPYTVQEEFFRRVDWAIDQALSRRLSVIVDWHHFVELMANPEDQQQRFLGIWRQISDRYRDRPASVAFELVNEPSGRLDAPRWNALLAAAIAVVRASNPGRIVVVDSCQFAAPQGLAALQIPAGDGGLVGSFHNYEPFLFTHQGAPWMGPEYQTRGILFPGPPPQPMEPDARAREFDWVREWIGQYNTQPTSSNPSGPAVVRRSFQLASEFVARTGLRAYMGEFAVIDNADVGSRAAYVRAVRQEAQRRGIGWAYWDDGGKNRIVDVARGVWVEPLRDALLGLP